MVSLRAALTVVGLLALFVLAPTAESDFSDWSVPENLGPIVNSSSLDAGPATSKDGLSLYMASTRPGGSGLNDIYVSQRDSPEEPWGAPINLGAVVNTVDTEAGPGLSRDGHWLFFQSNRPGGFGNLDIWVSYRRNTRNDFGWRAPVNLGPGINTDAFETGASYFENDDDDRYRRHRRRDRGDDRAVDFRDDDSDRAPQLFFSSNRLGGPGAFDIYVSELLPDDTFGPASLVPELSSPLTDVDPSLRFDGLEVFFFSGRPVSFGGIDMWTATRKRVSHPWSTPTNLGPLVNTGATDTQPSLGSDRQTLYFASNRDGGFGDLDLYVTTRVKERKNRGHRD